MRIQCPTHITRLPIPTILLHLPFITHLPIRLPLTIDHTAIPGLITLLTNQATTELPWQEIVHRNIGLDFYCAVQHISGLPLTPEDHMTEPFKIGEEFQKVS